MTVSRIRMSKSETRDLSERARAGDRGSGFQFDEPGEWKMSDRSFFAAFVVIAAVLAALALILRLR